VTERLPRLAATRLLRALRRDGRYEHVRRSSHVQLKHPSKPGRVTVPVHTGETVQPWLLASVLRQAGLTAAELGKLL
jgi:predicted RNA binding protein YcfA (HicA-like mRNA interferase family)